MKPTFRHMYFPDKIETLYQVSLPGFCLHLLTHRKQFFGTDTAEKNNVCRPTAVGEHLLFRVFAARTNIGV